MRDGRTVNLQLHIPGPFVSGNHAKTRDGRRTTAARQFDEKVKMLCAQAVRDLHWVAPDYVAVIISAINVGIDCDNLAKELLDPMQGEMGAFLHDSRVLALAVFRFKDDGEQRVLIEVAPASHAHGFTKPRKRKPARGAL